MQVRSTGHKLILALMWLTMVSSAAVFTEPAPVDVLMAGMIALLPLTGLVTITRPLLVFLCLWLIIAAGSFVAAMNSIEHSAAASHSSISLYLYVSAFIVGAFVAKQPGDHSRLILNGYLWAAVLAATTGLIGYFDVTPGSHELFTKFGRASGTFKDPNVLGPFLIPAVLYALHLTVTRRAFHAVLSLAITGLLALALLLSFSRGAWAAVAFASLVWAYLTFVTAPTNLQRIKVLAIVGTAIILATSLLVVALQTDAIADLFAERASLNQSYDFGPDGRFGGQDKAMNLIVSQPLGIGAATFSRTVHSENVHNVYMAMFLNAGWVGGFTYLLIIIVTVVYGLRHGLRPTNNQQLFIVVYAAFISNALQGLVIDTDHWRHFYLLLGLVWGLMCVDRSAQLPAMPHRRPLSSWAPRNITYRPARAATLNTIAIPQITQMAVPSRHCYRDRADRRSSSRDPLLLPWRSSPRSRRRHSLSYRFARQKICRR